MTRSEPLPPDLPGLPELHVGLLVIDHVREEFVATHGDYPAMFRSLLLAGAPPGLALRFTDFDVPAGELPADIDAADGWLITGSRDSVYDPLPWIEDLCAFVRRLHAAQRPLVGICFGHQLVADALGGRTAPADGGWAVGVHESRITASAEDAPRWLSSLPERFSLLSSHKDQVLELPPEARRLATNDFCPNAGFTVGEHLLCLQGHPEFSKPYARDLMNFRRELLGPAVHDAGIASLAEPIQGAVVGRWMLACLLQGRAAAQDPALAVGATP